MLEKIIKDPKLSKYLTTFNIGQTLFLEGDDSQDLFILVSGKLNIIKGTMKIAEITQKGAIFGEMSFFLGEGARRTATVKAKDDVKAIRVPKEEIPDFLKDFPPVASEIAKMMAQRLEETSQILYGLNEIYDQLPDAVIMTDKDGKILSWNSAAERLYGRDWDLMHHQPVEQIYVDPDEHRMFLQGKTRTLRFRLENARDDFRTFWQAVGAEGDLAAALKEWDTTYNASDRT